MAINQNVNINVNANTSDASADIDRLENNIKTLDGAINLVGGSIATLAGGLALSGAVTEEQAERFETAAIGAIALAEGSKRALEGFRVLVQETNLLTKASSLLNKVINANPYVLIATAIIGLVTAYVAFRESQEDTAESVETTNEKLERQIELLRDAKRVNQSGEAQLRKFTEASERNNTTIEEEIRLERERLDAAEERARKVASIESDDDRERRRLQLENIAQANTLVDEAEKLLAENRIKRAEDEEDERERQLKLRKEALAEEKRLEQEAFDAFEEQYNRRKRLEDKEFDERMARDRARYRAQAQAADRAREREEAIEQEKEDFIIGSIDNIQAASMMLFEDSKGLAKANVLIDAAQASVGIIKSAQNFKDPTGTLAIAYQVSQFALLAATVAKSFQQINGANVESGGGGTPSTPRPGTLSGPGFDLGAPQVGSASGVNTLTAVVLAGDVTSAQAQNEAIRNRRRFG